MAERSHRREQSFDRFTRDVAHDEYDARAGIGILPALERHRRMKNMLRSLQHHWAALAGHVDDTFHPQKIPRTPWSQGRPRGVEPIPGERRVKPQTESMNGGVVCSRPRHDALAEKAALLRLTRLGLNRIEPAVQLLGARCNALRTDIVQERRIELAIDGRRDER